MRPLQSLLPEGSVSFHKRALLRSIGRARLCYLLLFLEQCGYSPGYADRIISLKASAFAFKELTIPTFKLFPPSRGILNFSALCHA
jgi:hypothetical protein